VYKTNKERKQRPLCRSPNTFPSCTKTKDFFSLLSPNQKKKEYKRRSATCLGLQEKKKIWSKALKGFPSILAQVILCQNEEKKQGMLRQNVGKEFGKGMKTLTLETKELQCGIDFQDFRKELSSFSPNHISCKIEFPDGTILLQHLRNRLRSCWPNLVVCKNKQKK
jgi:hypothetical protein